MPTQTYTTTAGYNRVEIGSDGWDSTLILDQFDPTRGELISAVFSIDMTVDIEGEIIGDTSGGTTQFASLQGNFRFDVDENRDYTQGITGIYSVSAFDGAIRIGNFDPTSISMSQTYSSPDFDITNLTPLIGSQGFVMDIDSRESLFLNVGGGADGQEANLDVYSSVTITVEYTFESDTVTGTLGDGPVTTGLIGGADNDILTGTEVTDSLYGGAGNDILDGGLGPDRMDGGLGNDKYHIQDEGDLIIGEIGYALGGGIDTVFSSIDYTLERNVEILRLQGDQDLRGAGNAAPESLVGNTGNNELNGGGGDDKLRGKDGNDLLIGGFGQDTLMGNEGADTFRFTDYRESRAGRDDRDTINGFDRGADIIDLSAIDASTTQSGNQAFNFIDNAAFSGTAGELRWFSWGGNNLNVIEADIDGDGEADMQIFVNKANLMMESDFLL